MKGVADQPWPEAELMPGPKDSLNKYKKASILKKKKLPEKFSTNVKEYKVNIWADGCPVNGTETEIPFPFTTGKQCKSSFFFF